MSYQRVVIGFVCCLLTASGAEAARRRSNGKSPGVRARSKGNRNPVLTLHNINSRKTLRVRLFDKRGRLRKASAARLARFLKCRRTGRSRPVHWRLISSLNRIARRFPGHRLVVYSGYRHRRVSRLRESYHTKGRAIDLRVDGVSNRRLRDYLLASFRNVGVGYYPNSLFVHFDVRERSAFWIDFSGPGEAPRYAANARKLLAMERRGLRIGRRRRSRSGATRARARASRMRGGKTGLQRLLVTPRWARNGVRAPKRRVVGRTIAPLGPAPVARESAGDKTIWSGRGPGVIDHIPSG